MKTLTSKLFFAATTFVITLAGTCVHAAGFQHGFAADPDGKTLEIGIWYPSQTTAQPVAMGPTTMSVAVNGTAQGKALPLVVMSHGTGSSFLGHFDTAIALADAGFVVVAVTHTGDNYADQSRSVDVMDRPRQISRVIDHMLSTWDGHATIDPARIGMFGFSAGGFTTLVSIGGIPDFSKIGPMCRQYPGDFACQLIAKSGGNPAVPLYAEAVRLALRETPDYHVVPNAGHFDFLVPCSSALASIAPAICASAVGFDRAAFHASFNAAVVSFLNKTLKDGSGT